MRKRLLEFGDTPSSVLTIDEFMTVDLEAEQDPPAFKAARKKDRELIQKIAENEQEFTKLQREIESQLERDFRSRKRAIPFCGLADGDLENEDTVNFIRDSTLDTIQGCLTDHQPPSTSTETESGVVPEKKVTFEGIAPDVEAMCVPADDGICENQMEYDKTLEDLDDDEINSYILDASEAKKKDELWKKLNAEYLNDVKLREERLQKEREEGKPEKKRRKLTKKKNIEPSSTAGEAIEKMLQEKKISTKINYDILKSLTDLKTDKSVPETLPENDIEPKREPEERPKEMPTSSRRMKVQPNFPLKSNKKANTKNPVASLPVEEISTEAVPESEPEPDVEQDTESEAGSVSGQHSSLAHLLNVGAEDDDYGYDDEF